MKPPGLIAACCVFALAYAGTIATQTTPPPTQTVQTFSLPERPVALTEDTIKRFLFGFAPVAATVRELDGRGELAERTAVLDVKAAEYGFASFADWVDTTNTIMVTYHWAINPNPRAEVEKAIAEIPAMPNLSEQEKSDMIAGLRAGLARVENARPTPENMAIVQRHLRTLKPFYELWSAPAG
ncbi:hypothetical protein [Phyllobacterium endophyticum]|jgi:hypothetical protein|uniref:Uncharacterized protein n=1 Tax=Phyllobacterium endophyticum TaxID=1149773 RepID=A0A2P7AW95_9HYPH|nr:hypothetical protein [Phyllobacterium endophyticum]MBB3235085.1 hypothetical protein [Phyllobacterium endophyticum]PSH58482.1 hypothetical protein CU100_12880 [Phyllobacterium endophyticum]TXR48936.1 hypothetical protein FVA77_11610 [Phyllobacterium endophyticum]TYR39157.1 hypothetical protein FY050_24725 [Phyllobacterium endophyticum]